MADIPVAAPATRKQQWLQHMPETQRFMELCSQNNWKSLPGSRSQEERESGLKAFLEEWKKVNFESSAAQLAWSFHDYFICHGCYRYRLTLINLVHQAQDARERDEKNI
jgi:hypothetical protein